MPVTALKACDHITLQIPGAEEFLMVARLTASAVVSPGVADLETLEDIKTAVHEACYLMIHQSYAYERLCLDFVWDAGLTVFIIGQGACIAREGERSLDPDMCRIVLETLIVSAKIEMNGPCVAAVELKADAVRRKDRAADG